MKKNVLFSLSMTLAFFFLAGDCSFAAAPKATVVPADLTNAYITLTILGISAIFFFTELLPLPITAMMVPVALSFFNIIPAKEAFSNFGNQWVVIFVAMFIVGEATFITGFANKIGEFTIKLSKGSERRLMLFSMIFVGFLSAFLSNTGTTVVAIPMIMAMCLSAKIKPGRILMPVAFAASLGGTMTLVGTPPNGLINSVLEDMIGYEPFAFFEFAKFGIIIFTIGILYYLFIGYKFLPKSRVDEEETVSEKVLRPEKMFWSVGIFIFVVIAMATKFMPLVTAAMFGACLVVATRCMSMKEAFEAVDWTTIFLFAGMLAMSTAMQKSGAAALVAEKVVSNISNPYMLLAACCGLTAIVTNFMSNTATAALMAPLALPIALKSGISPLPLMMGIAMSASACFLTPIATPPNTIVLGPGKYTFMDYVKAGWPLQLMCFIACVVFIPLIWPF